MTFSSGFHRDIGHFLPGVTPGGPEPPIFVNSMKNRVFVIEKRDIHPRVGHETFFPGTPHTRRSDEGCARGVTIGVFRGSSGLGLPLRGLPVEFRQSEKNARKYDPWPTLPAKDKSLTHREVGAITLPAPSPTFARRTSRVVPC